jgi:hypothetical protein
LDVLKGPPHEIGFHSRVVNLHTHAQCQGIILRLDMEARQLKCCDLVVVSPYQPPMSMEYPSGKALELPFDPETILGGVELRFVDLVDTIIGKRRHGAELVKTHEAQRLLGVSGAVEANRK